MGSAMEYDVMVGKFGAFFVNKGDKWDGLDTKDKSSLTPFNTKYFDTTPVMQYTGLKDKDWKEIYEWDIIYCPVNKALAVVKYNEKMAQYRFYFFSWNRTDLTDRFNYHWTELFSWFNGWSSIEIKWNIYQNPELLSPTK